MGATKEIKALLDSGETDKAKIIKEVINKTGSPKKYVYKAYRTIMAKGRPNKKKETQAVRTIKMMDLVTQERLDHAKIVRAALKQFEPDDCAYDDHLCRDLEIAKDRWKDVRDFEEFHNNQVLLPTKKRIWCLPSRRLELLKLDGVREV